MYKETDDCIELTLSIGEVIQYEFRNETIEGRVMEIAEELNMIKVLPLNTILKIPEWISADDVLLDEDVEFV